MSASDPARLLRERRVQYETAGLDRGDLADDPIVQWHRWYADAVDAGVTEPNAMTLATVDLDGTPDARLLLVRGVDERGLAFYSNFDSPKGVQLAEHPDAALVFGWLDLHRQVRVRGHVTVLDAAESDAYFASRPREHQLGAWSSAQSRILHDRAELERRLEEVTLEREGAAVPRPPYWGGWRLHPHTWEFWQGRPHRLHDRFRYRRGGADASGDWIIERLSP